MLGRRTTPPFDAHTLWVFAPDIDAAHREMVARGIARADDLEEKPWGLRQFTITDPDGHRHHIHHDLGP